MWVWVELGGRSHRKLALQQSLEGGEGGTRRLCQRRKVPNKGRKGQFRSLRQESAWSWGGGKEHSLNKGQKGNRRKRRKGQITEIYVVIRQVTWSPAKGLDQI